MIYDIDHVTTYEYGSRVGGARCVLRLEPRREPGQDVLSAGIDVDPAPMESASVIDFFGNAVRVLRFGDPHATLVIRARSRVVVQPPADVLWATPWETVRDGAARVADLGPASPIHHLFASRYVPLPDSVTAYAAPSFPAGRSVADGALDLACRIHADFAYDPAATDVSTPVADVMATRRGVCQDFAHLMIAGLRGLGLPAAYVSGYLRTRPPAGRERLAGADATHAWVSVWCGPEAGWIGFDPTNALRAGDDHVVLARGRDYADVAPVSGVVLASAGQRLAVSVDVRPVDTPQALAG